MMCRTGMGFALALFCAPLACAQNVVKYHTTMDDVKYTYNSTSAPVAKLASGDILETNTVGRVRQRDSKARRHDGSCER